MTSGRSSSKTRRLRWKETRWLVPNASRSLHARTGTHSTRGRSDSRPVPGESERRDDDGLHTGDRYYYLFHVDCQCVQLSVWWNGGDSDGPIPVNATEFGVERMRTAISNRTWNSSCRIAPSPFHMPPSQLTEPATEATLADAKRLLEAQRQSIRCITLRIEQSQAALAQIVADSKCVIDQLEQERNDLENDMFQTMAYLSPIRRLPLELLRQIFLFNFEDHPCAAWVLSAVCNLWRKTAISMPRIWSKVGGRLPPSSLRVQRRLSETTPLTHGLQIRLLTTQHSSADIIRLWLERSGNTVPLDIEIYLRVNKGASESVSRPRPPSPTWGHAFPSHPSTTTHYVIPHHPHPGTAIPILPPPAQTATFIVPPPATAPIYEPYVSAPSSPPADRSSPPSRTSMHWGYIAVYYLVEQMHRWQRFVFRFDKHFSSMSALKSITGKWHYLDRGHSLTP